MSAEVRSNWRLVIVCRCRVTSVSHDTATTHSALLQSATVSLHQVNITAATRQINQHGRSLGGVCRSVCVSVCNSGNFENLYVRKYTINLKWIRIKFVYEGHLVKVTGIKQCKLPHYLNAEFEAAITPLLYKIEPWSLVPSYGGLNAVTAIEVRLGRRCVGVYSTICVVAR